MAIVVNLDVMMAKRKKGLTELAGEVDITMANLSILKNNKAKAVRFTTLEAVSYTHLINYRRPCDPSDHTAGRRGSDIWYLYCADICI